MDAMSATVNENPVIENVCAEEVDTANQCELEDEPSGSIERRKTMRNVPLGQRRARRIPSSKRLWYERLMWRLCNDSPFLRTLVQSTFVLLCIWIGIELHLFVRCGLTNGASPYVTRPPGVEGFLPISALISLKYWVQSGIINDTHPSGLFILLAILGTGFFLKKAFRSWFCPVGTLSESLWILGEKLLGRTLYITKWLDYPLRALKYLSLLFFVYAIWHMDVPSLKSLIESPHNEMADAKMYLFFANISTFALWTIIVLVILSVVVKNFWCRYLCPYGALLGALSIFSPLKITRQKNTCIDCELCMKACPAAIPVHKATRVWSDECTACYRCVDVCPVKNTLDVRLADRARPVPAWAFGSLAVAVFVAVTGLAMLADRWQNSIGKEEYSSRFQELNSAAYEHFGSGGGSDATGR